MQGMREGTMRQCLIGAFATCAAVVFAAGTATAQDTVNVGFVLPMTGPVAVGKQVSAGAQLYFSSMVIRLPERRSSF